MRQTKRSIKWQGQSVFLLLREERQVLNLVEFREIIEAINIAETKTPIRKQRGETLPGEKSYNLTTTDHCSRGNCSLPPVELAS